MAAPPNGTCATAIDVTALLPYSAVIDTTNASTDTEVTPTCDGLGGLKAVWWKVSNSSLTTYAMMVVNTAGFNYYQDISVWSGVCGGLTQIQCNKDPYDGFDMYFSFAAAPGQTYYILILDNDIGAGGSLHLTISSNTLVNGSLAVVNDHFTDFLQWGTAYDNTGIVIAYDTSIQPPSLAGWTALAQRPSDNFLIATAPSNKLYTLSPSMGLIATTTTIPPNTVPALGWDAVGIYYDSSGTMYLLWRGHQGGQGYHCVEKRNPTTFALIQQWLTFDPTSFLGGNIVGGAVSPSGTALYYGWADSGQTNRNVIRVLNLTTGVPSNFATYSTWNNGTATGYSVHLSDFRVDESGNVYVVFIHLTSNATDGAHLVKYDSSGVLVFDYALTITGGGLVNSVAITPDDDFAWVITTNDKLDKYQLSDGTRTIARSLSSTGNYGDLLVLGLTPPVPPPGTLTGIYYIKSGKTNDTYFTNLTTHSTTNVKIPDPFAITAFIGDE